MSNSETLLDATVTLPARPRPELTPGVDLYSGAQMVQYGRDCANAQLELDRASLAAHSQPSDSDGLHGAIADAVMKIYHSVPVGEALDYSDIYDAVGVALAQASRNGSIESNPKSRLEAEIAELEGRAKGLNDFMKFSPAFQSLSHRAHRRLEYQIQVMYEYLTILRLRLKLDFSDAYHDRT